MKLALGNSFAFVISKDTFSNKGETIYNNENELSREDIIDFIINRYPNDIYISTTGKASRELFEIREKRHEEHANDFLTVGSMGHSSMIALGIANQLKNSRVWCLDGDGAVLMHMGALAVIGSSAPGNFVHVVLNNYAHDSVGGMPTVSANIDLTKIAYGCGYKRAESIDNQGQLSDVLTKIDRLEGPVLLDVKTRIGSRPDLGRPTTTTIQNKNSFMDLLEERK
jgi:phosphonopyruvate decarboxylase